MRPVFAALDANDVRSTTIGSQQIGAVGAGEQRRHRVGARQEPDNVVVRAGGEHRRQDIVPRTLGTKLHA